MNEDGNGEGGVHYNGPLTDDFFLLLTTHLIVFACGVCLGAGIVMLVLP